MSNIKENEIIKLFIVVSYSRDVKPDFRIMYWSRQYLQWTL